MSEENLNITTTNKYNASLESEKELKVIEPWDFLGVSVMQLESEKELKVSITSPVTASTYFFIWNPRRN